MSLASLPIEIVTHIFDLLDKSESKKPFKSYKHREMCNALMALRLTCKELEKIATRQLFRTVYLFSSWNSWSRVHAIAANQKLRVHLQTLALDFRKSRKDKYTLMIRDPIAMKSPEFRHLDLSLFPNFKVLKVEDTWIMTKRPRSNVRIPLGRCGIHPVLFCNDRPFPQSVLENLRLFDFSVSYMTCKLGEYTLREDFSDLVYLRLYVVGAHTNQIGLEADLDLLAKLKHLPSLEEFHLDQYFHGRSDDCQTLRAMINVLKELSQGKNWPRLRHLNLQFPATTVEDLKAFVAPHAAGGTLQTFKMYGGLVCAQVTAEEKLQRYDLPNWIRTVICPQGGGARFDQVGGTLESSPWPHTLRRCTSSSLSQPLAFKVSRH